MTKRAKMMLREAGGLLAALMLLATALGCDFLNPPATPPPLPTLAALPAGFTVVPRTSPTVIVTPTLTYTPLAGATLTSTVPLTNALANTPSPAASLPVSSTARVSATASLSATATPVPTATPAPPPPSSTQFLYATAGGTLHLRDASGKQDVAVSPGAALGSVDAVDDFAAFHLVSWSPHGRLLTYANSVVGGVDIVDVDKAASEGADSAALHIEATGPNDVAWSPDGRYLAISQRAGDEQGYQLNIVDTQSGAALTDIPDGELRDIAWSPVSDTLAYSIVLPGETPPFGQVYTATVNGGQLGQAVQVAADGENPQWSPDGRLIAYTRAAPPSGRGRPPARFDVHVVGADGSNDHVAITNTLGSYDPAWRPPRALPRHTHYRACR
jgi:hypothetical protein